MKLDKQPPSREETHLRFQSDARLKKAVALVAALHAAGAVPENLDPTQVDPALVETLWAQAVALAGVKPPSSETKALVLQGLAELNAHAAANPDSDPFEGLPS